MRNQRRSAVVKPAHAPSPQSVSAFQRSAHRPVRYWIWTRCCDGRAGLADRDRRKPEETPTARWQAVRQSSTASSPWLDRLCAEYTGAVEEERLAAMAAVSVLSAQWVVAEQASAQAAADAEVARSRRSDLASAPLNSAPSTAGEHYETATEILSRRETTRRKQDAEVSAQLDRLAAVQARSAAAMADCADAITSHWNALLIRVASLSAYYTRRAGTYTRWLKDWHVPNLRPPVMAPPPWAAGTCPWSPPAAAVSAAPRMAANDDSSVRAGILPSY
jgi:hypothetical protein